MSFTVPVLSTSRARILGTARRLRRAPVVAGSVVLAAIAGVAVTVLPAPGWLAPGSLADLAAGMLRVSAEAYMGLYEAARGDAGSGEREYAVLLADGGSDAGLEAFLATRTGLRRLRASDVPGWVVIAVSDRGALAALEEQPFVRLALPSRGIWLCH